MAEIRVEPKKRSLAWLWILLLLIVAAAVAWYFMNNSRAGGANVGADSTRTGAVQVAAPRIVS